MEDDLREAAAHGIFDPFNEHLDHLDCIVTPNGDTILHIHVSCARVVSTNFIKQVLVNCAKLLSQENSDGNTPLHIAARHGHTDAAEKLIKQAEALHDAIDIQSGEVVTKKKMAAVRDMLRKVNKKKETALHVACSTKWKKFGSCESKEDPHFTCSANDSGETPLYLAVDNTCTNIVAELLNNPNSQSLEYGGPDDDTVLHMAVERWDTEVVLMLLEKQSSLAAKKGRYGWTPLHLSAYEGSSSMVATLLDKDKSIASITDGTEKFTALHMAALQGFKHAMNEIISKCPDFCKLTDRRGNNILHSAVYSQNEEVLKAILENSSLISLIIGKDDRGNTRVHAFMALNLPLPSFIIDGDTDAFILWKKLYYNIPKDFTIKVENNSSQWIDNQHSLGFGISGRPSDPSIPVVDSNNLNAPISKSLSEFMETNLEDVSD
ncbi:hypothetical protein GH714_003158 [Hevea brasiliensis]|uniref:Uncharacterized protein n=1 Tax=Hevea brasiliensis TaxID=3981 RepID=A0A6A6MAE4_HEVBR|nr:hypothetical protein GH714_003158 [Hevea brasiliensis]